LRPGQDYYLLDVSNWMKVLGCFGGAPEIVIYKNDFKPYKIKVTLIAYDSEKQSLIEAPPSVENTFLLTEKVNLRVFEKSVQETMGLDKRGCKIRATYVVHEEGDRIV
jgi:hypothetical protein